MTGIGPVAVRQPRVRDRGAGGDDPAPPHPCRARPRAPSEKSPVEMPLRYRIGSSIATDFCCWGLSCRGGHGPTTREDDPFLSSVLRSCCNARSTARESSDVRLERFRMCLVRRGGRPARALLSPPIKPLRTRSGVSDTIASADTWPAIVALSCRQGCCESFQPQPRDIPIRVCGFFPMV
jgi:hypothetical protein